MLSDLSAVYIFNQQIFNVYVAINLSTDYIIIILF